MKPDAALITGGARRLGKAMALSLAQRGHDIALHYAGSARAAEDTAQELRAIGVTVVLLQADLTCEDETQQLLARATRELKQPCGVLINNASIFEYDTLRSATRDGWDRHMESNLRAPFVLTQAFAAQAPEAKVGDNGELSATSCVINMIDQRVRKLTPEFMSYTIAKMGLWAFTQTAARSLAPHVRVNAIGPGSTIRGARQSAQHFDRQRKNTILKRGSNPTDIVAAMNFILDSPAFTGQLLCTDGGQHLAWQTPDIQSVDH